MRVEIYNTALGFLSRREYGAVELQRKLQRKFSDTSVNVIAEILAQLTLQDYQNDLRYAEQIIRAKINAYYGWNYIKQYLRQQGIDADIVQQAHDAMDIDWQALAQVAYKKKYRDLPIKDFQDRMRRKTYLVRKGFDFDEVDTCSDQPGL